VRSSAYVPAPVALRGRESIEADTRLDALASPERIEQARREAMC
jgi:hypothetical protein